MQDFESLADTVHCISISIAFHSPDVLSAVKLFVHFPAWTSTFVEVFELSAKGLQLLDGIRYLQETLQPKKQSLAAVMKLRNVQDI